MQQARERGLSASVLDKGRVASKIITNKSDIRNYSVGVHNSNEKRIPPS